MIKDLYPFIVIETKQTHLIFEIKPFNDAYSDFHKGKLYITQKYYGKKIDLDSLEISKPLVNQRGSNEEYNIDFLISSSVGNGNNNEPSIILDLKEETYTCRFFYEKHEIIEGGISTPGPHSREVKESLIIKEIDDINHLEIKHIYSIFEDSDVIAIKKEIINHGDEIKIKRLSSLELPINSINLDVYSFDGKWLYERNRHITNIQSGVFMIDSKIGSSSHKHNPFIEIYDKDNKNYYGINLIYSGNHQEIIEVDACYHSHLIVGINDFCFEYSLKNNESFITPEAIMVIKDNLDDITLEMHHFILNHIIHPDYKNKPRPVIFNNWEGTGMKIDDTSLLEMAEIASKVGVEQFVMDDGWFKNRNKDTQGLGDWEVDLAKFPSGLDVFASKIKQHGLKFGIWIEPEMICIDSDLYRLHKEYASIIPGREPIERRHQLMIDMTNNEVVDYLFNSISKVIDIAKPDYIKWDYNRFMSDNYSSKGTKKGEYMYRFIMGTYDLIERLRNKYPNILFESCSSGGGRYDLGMLYYMPQTWGSDDTNTYWRSFITCGTLAGYHQSTFGAHVSRDGNPHPSRGGRSSLEDRFNLNAIGAFGYEFDFRTYQKEELDVIAKQIKFYKEHRDLLQYGDYQVIDNCFDDGRYFSYIVTSKNKEEAILMISELEPHLNKKKWKLKGIREDYHYHLTMREQYNLRKEDLLDKVILGKELLLEGLDISSLYNTTDKELYNGVFSRLIYLKKE